MKILKENVQISADNLIDGNLFIIATEDLLVEAEDISTEFIEEVKTVFGLNEVRIGVVDRAFIEEVKGMHQ
jgi:hypothetical protein